MSHKPTEPSVDLSAYTTGAYDPGPWGCRVLWYVVSRVVFDTGIPWPSGVKAGVLRAFGAKVGEGVVIKPKVRIKAPWLFSVGDHAWIGEGAWIENVAPVSVGAHACLSQGAFVVSGNHDWSSRTFDLRLDPIEIGNGAWVGSKAIVCPGVTIESHAVLQAGSVGKGTLEANGIYEGNPAVRVGVRTIGEAGA